VQAPCLDSGRLVETVSPEWSDEALFPLVRHLSLAAAPARPKVRAFIEFCLEILTGNQRGRPAVRRDERQQSRTGQRDSSRFPATYAVGKAMSR